MKCPNDNATLVMSERSGVEIDYCPECRGVWLDRGELDKIIQNSRLDNTQTEQRYGRSEQTDYRKHDNHYEQKPKKKENFIGDLFDF
jgi:Zn-finger nucleic acid-binding protein